MNRIIKKVFEPKHKVRYMRDGINRLPFIYELNILIFILLTFLLRSAIPFLKFLFIPIFVLYFLYTISWIIFNKSKIKYNFKLFIHNFYPYLLITIAYSFAILWTRGSYNIIYKEFITIIIFIIVMILCTLYIENHSALKLFFKYFILHVFILSVMISLFGLLKYFLFLNNTELEFLKVNEIYPSGTSLVSDYNFFILNLIIGVVVSLYYLAKHLKIIHKILIQFVLIILNISILFSTSRRGIFIFILIVFLLLLTHLAYYIWKIEKVRDLVKNTVVFMLVMFVIILFPIYFFFLTSDNFKDNVVAKLGDKHVIKNEITSVIIRYATIFNKSIDYDVLYHKLWNDDLIKRLNGESHAKFINSIKHINEVLFNTSHFEEKIIIHEDFKKETTSWHKWGNSDYLIVPSENKLLNNYLYISSYHHNGGISGEIFVESFDTITYSAYVNILKWSRSLRLMARDSGNQKYEVFHIPEDWEGDNMWHKVFITVRYVVNDNLGFWIGGGAEPPNESISCWTNINVVKGKNIKKDEKLLLPQIDLAQLKLIQNQLLKKDKEKTKNIDSKNDMLDDILIKMSKVDTFYYPNKLRNYSFDSNILFGSRINRWAFAWDIFKNEYTLDQKIWGGGFNYLSWFGKKFFGNPFRLDWPHNPIISSFLYSGIIGGGFYIYFIIMSFWYYWKYRKYHTVFFVMYIITWFFAFFSGNTHFGMPILTFLSLIPFLTRYDAEREKIELKGRN